MKITIKTIPHNYQKYPTVGDWIIGDNEIKILVSDMNDWKKEALVGIHELCEVLLCKDRGIKEEDVTAFDIQFEKERESGQHTPDEEPGYNDKAPYKKEHFIAEIIERIMASALNVDWKEYDDTVMAL